MNSVFAGLVGLGLLAVGATHVSAPETIATPALVPAAISAAPATAAASAVVFAPPTDLEGDDSGDYMKHMTSAELGKLYAQHDADVAQLMAVAEDDPVMADVSLVDPLTGEEASIDDVAF